MGRNGKQKRPIEMGKSVGRKMEKGMDFDQWATKIKEEKEAHLKKSRYVRYG